MGIVGGGYHLFFAFDLAAGGALLPLCLFELSDAIAGPSIISTSSSLLTAAALRFARGFDTDEVLGILSTSITSCTVEFVARLWVGLRCC